MLLWLIKSDDQVFSGDKTIFEADRTTNDLSDNISADLQKRYDICRLYNNIFLFASGRNNLRT